MTTYKQPPSVIWNCGSCGLPVLEQDAHKDSAVYHNSYKTCIRLLRKEIDSLKDRLTLAEADIRRYADEADDLEAQVSPLRAGLKDAIECVEEWAAYASPYFQEKHDLAGDLARLRAVLGPHGDDDQFSDPILG